MMSVAHSIINKLRYSFGLNLFIFHTTYCVLSGQTKYTLWQHFKKASFKHTKMQQQCLDHAQMNHCNISIFALFRSMLCIYVRVQHTQQKWRSLIQHAVVCVHWHRITQTQSADVFCIERGSFVHRIKISPNKIYYNVRFKLYNSMRSKP